MNQKRNPKPGDCFVVNSRCDNPAWVGSVLKFERFHQLSSLESPRFEGKLVKLSEELARLAFFRQNALVDLFQYKLTLVCSECFREDCLAI